MKAKNVEIITLILENKEKELNIHSISTLLKKDYKTIYTIIKRLEKASIISLERFGKSYKIILNNKIHPLIFEAEYSRRNELLRNKNFSVMLDSFKKLNTKLYVILLFGSYAKNKSNKNSDIDLMFIVPDSSEKELEREIYNIAGTLPLNLHINVFKESDFIAMKDSKKETVGSEAIKNNVILYGIEQYYEMIT